MKNLLAVALLVVVLSACNAPQETGSNTDKANTGSVVNATVLHFVGPMDLTVSLKSTNNFETAVMTDNADRVFQMHSAPAANGVRMIDGKGASIHFKAGEGVVEFLKDKPISIQEVRE